MVVELTLLVHVSYQLQGVTVLLGESLHKQLLREVGVALGLLLVPWE